MWDESASGTERPSGDSSSATTPTPTDSVNHDENQAPVGAANAQPSQNPTPQGSRGAFPSASLAEAEPGQTYFELRYTVDGTDIQGNAERSFLHEGINHIAEFSFFNAAPFGENRRFEVLAIGRYTNDPTVDPERTSLQRGYLRLSGPTFDVNLGDALINYSRLSFNQNMKGLSISKKLSPSVKASGTVGFFVDRWGSLYRDYTFFRDLTGPANPLLPEKPYSRFVAGARLEKRFGRASWIATNWSHGKDLQQSLPDATLACENGATALISIRQISTGCLTGEAELPGFQRPFVQAINNDVLSGDANVQVTRLRLNVRGEFAYSWTAGGTPPTGANTENFVCAPEPPVFGAAVLDARCFSGQVGDWAGRFEARQQIHKFNWRVDYSRFEPNFLSANARDIQDLQDFTFRGEYELSRNISIVGSWRRSNDNLNGLNSFTSIVRAPEGRLILRELPFYRRMIIEAGYRERNLDTSGNPLPSEMQKLSTRIPFVSVSLPFGRSQLSLEYERRHAMNAVSPQLATDTDHYGASFRGHYSFGGWEFSPTGRFEYERLDKQAPVNAAMPITEVTLLFGGDFLAAFDTNRTIQGGFLLDAPRYFRLEGSYKEFNSLVLSPLQTSVQLNPQTPFLYFNQGYKRPSWRGAVTFKIANDENRTVTAFYIRTNNHFPTGDPFIPDLRSFSETVIGGSIVFRFRK